MVGSKEAWGQRDNIYGPGRRTPNRSSGQRSGVNTQLLSPPAL